MFFVLFRYAAIFFGLIVLVGSCLEAAVMGENIMHILPKMLMKTFFLLLFIIFAIAVMYLIGYPIQLLAERHQRRVNDERNEWVDKIYSFVSDKNIHNFSYIKFVNSENKNFVRVHINVHRLKNGGFLLENVYSDKWFYVNKEYTEKELIEYLSCRSIPDVMYVNHIDLSVVGRELIDEFCLQHLH